MAGGDDGGVGPEVAVIADGDLCIVLDRQVEVPEEALADLRVLAIVERNGPLNEQPFAELP